MKDEKLVRVLIVNVTRQPLLTNFSSTVFASAKRKTQATIRSFKRKIQRDSLSGYALLFEPILPSNFLQNLDQTKRQRIYGNLPTFWAWLGQILDQNAPCTKAVGMVQTWNIAHNLIAPSSNTTSYCDARQRLPLNFLEAIASRSVNSLNQRIGKSDQWRGHTLKAIDGSSLQLLDSAKNQAAYPQPVSQKEGCGFPVMGIVGVINLSHGGWEGFETFAGRKHDSKVAPKLLHHVEAGDLMLADRAFCTYQYIAQLIEKKAHCVMRLHQARARKLDWRRGKKLSPIERLIVWRRPVNVPPGSDLTTEEWNALPAEMTMRYVKLGYENRAGEKQMLVVVTDLLDPVAYPAEEVADLYLVRWEIEVKLRDLKTTLSFEKLRVKTPELARKTVLMIQIAYNLTRALMQQAAHESRKKIGELSFKATVDLLTSINDSYRPLAGKPKKLARRHRILLETIGTKNLTIRPYRGEPRVVKQRPKSYPYLTKPRHIFEEKDTRIGVYRKRRKAA